MLAWVMLAGSAGCTAKIGDPCSRAFDCSLRGERQCDLSNRARSPDGKGECTIENCSFGGCPKEAVCIQAWSTEFLSVACDPDREDRESEDPLNPDGPLLEALDDCEPHQICLPEGLCADQASSRNSCRRECKRDSQCRNGYECVPTGIDGVYVAPDPADADRTIGAHICVPRED